MHICAGPREGGLENHRWMDDGPIPSIEKGYICNYHGWLQEGIQKISNNDNYYYFYDYYYCYCYYYYSNNNKQYFLAYTYPFVDILMDALIRSHHTSLWGAAHGTTGVEFEGWDGR